MNKKALQAQVTNESMSYHSMKKLLVLELEELRTALESNRNNDDRTFLQGQIAVIKALLKLLT